MFTENVVVELIETAGQSAIYASTEIVNPSPVNSPTVTYQNEEPATLGIAKKLIVPTNQKQVRNFMITDRQAIRHSYIVEINYPCGW